MELPNRLPVPSLRTYSVLNVCALSCSIYYAAQTVQDPAWKANATRTEMVGTTVKAERNQFIVRDILECMIDEPVCVWTLINMAYCILIFLGKTLQKLVFGKLRASEKQHLKDKFWNFVFYKFIFVVGVLNVQYMDEVLMWWAWFTALGFLTLLSQLCKDRIEYLSFSPTTSGWSHVRLLVLLGAIFALSCFMLLLCICAAFFFVSFNTFAFTAAECILLGVRTLHVMLRYAIHLYDTRGASNATQRSWEKRGLMTYYMDLCAELTVLVVDFLHHSHMLLWINIFLSMASVVICMQLRYLFYEIQRRISRHSNYLAVLNHMEQNYPMASESELSGVAACAICWESMYTARRLPCGHLFHNTCLQSWLEQETSCPTCRLALSMQNHRETQREPNDVDTMQSETRRPGENQNHFFHFDGSRYVSWLPSFSVEVGHRVSSRMRNSQVDAMARQVQQLFPHYPQSVILEDLRLTRSVELTVENILDGALTLPHHLIEEPRIEPRMDIPDVTPQFDTNANDQSDNDGRFDLNMSEAWALEEGGSALGGRFSKSSVERERMLQRRKAHMRLQARKKYLERHRAETSAKQAGKSQEESAGVQNETSLRESAPESTTPTSD